MLIRHTALNLVGLGLPLLVAVATLPALIAGLGEARFGVLALIWAVVGYFGVLDLGVGRALTMHVAPALARRDAARVGRLVGSGLAMLAALGAFAGALLAVVADAGVAWVRELPDAAEAHRAVLAMAVGLPFVVATAGLRGVLEADHRFGIINAVRIPLGLLTFVGPLAVIAAGSTALDAIAWVLVAGRIAGCIAHAVPAWGVLRRAGARPTVDATTVRVIAGSAGWLGAGTAISFLMNVVDRFVIGATLSASAVAHYATPHEMVTKLAIVPGALTAVLFPRFSTQAQTGDAAMRAMHDRSALALAALLLPVVAALAWWAEPLLAAWIDPAFARESAPVLQVLAWGMYASGVASVPYTLLQGAGHARSTAILHALELLPYVAVLVVATARWGLVGAALAWTLRCAVDAVALFALAARVLRVAPARAAGSA